MTRVVQRIAFLGAGAMGAPMTLRLLAHRFPVVVWSRDPAKHAELATAGASVTSDLAAAVEGADVVLGCLRDTAVTRDVYLGPDGVLSRARPGQVLVEHGTFDPALAEEIAHAAREKECAFMDAPITGGPERARTGELVTMVGGDVATFGIVEPVLRAFSRDVAYVGGAGSGERLKLINQLLVTIHSLASAEASALVLREGLDPEVAHRVLTGGWAGSAMLDRCMPRSLRGDYADTGASVSKLTEVQPLIEAMVQRSGIDARLYPTARAALFETVVLGEGRRDLSVLLRRY